jgi:hypothetical protein
VGKPEGKRPLEEPAIDGRIKINLQEVVGVGGRGGMDWIELAQDRDMWQALVNAVINLLFP